MAALLLVMGSAFCWGVAVALPINGYWDHLDLDSWFPWNTGSGSGSGFAPMAKRISKNYNDFKDWDEEQIRFSIILFVCVCCDQATTFPIHLMRPFMQWILSIRVKSLFISGFIRISGVVCHKKPKKNGLRGRFFILSSDSLTVKNRISGYFKTGSHP